MFMISDSIFFATILGICSILGAIGGILGIFSFLYIWKESKSIEFLVDYFGIKEGRNEHKNRKEKDIS
jgi:hypothetical protein